MVADKFLCEVVRLHGIPRFIVSDRDMIFLSKFWRELFKHQGSTLARSTAYHPQTDGQTKVVNRYLETYLRCFSSDMPRQWSKWLPWVEYWYNTSFHTATQMTPFCALYGRDPPPLLRYGLGLSPVAIVDLQLADRDATLDLLKQQLQRAQQKMKTRAGGSRCVFPLSAHQSRLSRLPFDSAATCFGLYYLGCCSVATAYSRYGTSESSCAKGSQPSFSWFYFEVEFLIHWYTLPDHEDSWENFDCIQAAFPDFHLADKVHLWAGGIDGFPRPPLRFTYARRRPKGGRVNVAAREAGEVEPVRGKKGADMEVAHGAGVLAPEGSV
ncbi:uncharacterized protein LOC112094347 [Morus notabilis]|uniref:uncharacterized protein LOC112094347 n=1 Tax=Morus notabilis TaxID=981085 RepID=UPI000CED3A5C|nr:uncharacterized protein LOC112094347 [Morus notabilis]